MGGELVKIHNTMEKLSGLNETLSKEDRRKKGISQSTFNSRLRKIEGHDYKQKLTFLLKEIDEQGEKLSKHIDIRDIKRYRKLISEFLYEAVNHSHKFQKENILDRRGRHRVYGVINKINQELEELTQEVLKEEKDNINILQKIDEIRGLLLDIII